MIAFEIQLNGEHICTAGVDQEGVLTTIATWVKRTVSDPTSDELTNFEFEEELMFDVGGLTHSSDGANVELKWIDRTLQVGDEICIKVVRTSQVDEPMRREQEDLNFLERQEQQCYEQLKRKYVD
jgi:hypothetical protein